MNTALPLIALSLTAAAPASVTALRWEKRVLLVAAPGEQDRAFRQQRAIVARWAAAARDRDLHVVEIVGDKVTGASDAPARLRERFTLPSRTFTVVLIGKDGGVKLRRSRPVAATVLEETIDAMPMRRAGQR